MNQRKIEERVAALENQMMQLQENANGVPSEGWRSTVGMFTGDPIMKHIDRAARKIREADRRRARRANTSKVRAKK